MRAVHAMESRDFCASCHVMTPEARAFELGPHAGHPVRRLPRRRRRHGLHEPRLQGTRQLVSVLTDSVHTPIATAIESRAHGAERGDLREAATGSDSPRPRRLKMIRRYAEDEANTPETTLLTMKVGGERMGGIHGAHHGEGIEIDFVARERAAPGHPAGRVP